MANLAAVVGIGQTNYTTKRDDVSIAGLVREAADRFLVVPDRLLRVLELDQCPAQVDAGHLVRRQDAETDPVFANGVAQPPHPQVGVR